MTNAQREVRVPYTVGGKEKMFPKMEVGFVKNVKGCDTYSLTAGESRVGLGVSI